MECGNGIYIQCDDTYNVTIKSDATTRSAGTPGCEVKLVEVQDMNAE